MAKEKIDFREEITAKIIADLEKGVVPWEKPWEAGEVNFSRPYNAVTGREYHGGNAFALFYSGNADPRWATFNQVQDAGWKVKSGSKGVRIEFWTTGNEKQVKDEHGNPVKDAKGKPVKEKYEYSRPVSRTYYVFNGSQIEGIPPLPEKDKEQHKWESVERAEQIIKNSGAVIYHDQADRAFYRPSTDAIHLPPKNNFPDQEKYYGTVLHEIGHWTGHQTRLDRDLGHGFGSEKYAKEELRAELASAFLSMETGVKPNLGRHAAYIQSWISVLKDDKHEIFRASKDADKITEYVLAFEKEMRKEKGGAELSGVEAGKDSREEPNTNRQYVLVDAKGKAALETMSQGIVKSFDQAKAYVSQKESLLNLDERLTKEDKSPLNEAHQSTNTKDLEKSHGISM